MDRDLGSFKRARSAGEGSWTAGGWTRQRVLGGVIVDARHHHRHHNHHHPRRLVQTQRRVISRRGGERKTAKWRSREAPVCRKECRRAPRLLSSLQTAGCCAFRKKHAATARPPVLWRNPRSKKKRKGGKKRLRSGKKRGRLPFSYSSSSSSCSSGLHCPQSGLSFVWAGEFWGLNLSNVNVFIFFFFRKKYRWLFWRMFFTWMDTEMECFNSREFFVE